MSRRLLSCLVCATALLTACNARPVAAVTPRLSPTATITVSRDLARLPLIVTAPRSSAPVRQAVLPAPTHKVPTQPAPVVADGPYPLAAWYANRVAIGRCESRNNYRDKANPKYRGYYQMGYREWFDTGGRGDPADAPPAEQDARALRLYEARGFEPWSCARILGLYP